MPQKDNVLSRKSSLAFLLSWLFGVLFALIGFISVSSDLIPGLSFLVISALLIPPSFNFIQKTIKIKLTKKIKAIIIIVCLVIFGATTNFNNHSTDKVVQTATPQKQEQDSTVPIVNDVSQEIAQEQTTPSEPEKTEINPASTDSQDNIQNTELPENVTEYYTVAKVVDGDTIDVDMNGITERLRLIGIDTPEVVDPRKTVECFGIEASKKASEILLNQKVRLESDPTQDNRDKYGRLSRYVYREDGLFYNKWMIENGYAYEYTYTIPYKYQTEFKQAENYARENQLGLWHANACNNEEETTTESQSMLPAQQDEAIKEQQEPVMQPDEASGHIFYTSGYFTSKYYYCDTDSDWKSLSEKYLESYPSEAALLKVYPSKTLHEPCK